MLNKGDYDDLFLVSDAQALTYRDRYFPELTLDQMRAVLYARWLMSRASNGLIILDAFMTQVMIGDVGYATFYRWYHCYPIKRYPLTIAYKYY